MDGNNRWSKKNQTNRSQAYKKGGDNLLKIANYIFNKYKVKYVSSFALSFHNLKRSNNFLNIFLEVFKTYINNLSIIDNYNFKVKFIGDLSFIKDIKVINQVLDLEKKNLSSDYTLLIYLNYSGQIDIFNAAKKFSKNNSVQFENYLSTKLIPNPDILIRTGGFQRISDFMLYQISFTELFFTKILWPDLKLSHIDKFIIKFSKLERKFGI